MKIKVCKSCGTENSPLDIECRECMGDISGIKSVEKIDKTEISEQNIADNSSSTIRDVKKNLVLISISAARNGDILTITDGDTLGREHVGEELFAVYNTISRKHAKIIYSCGEWIIEDVGSTNGTYVNGKKLESGQKHPLKAKDILALSKSCEFLVEVGG